MTAERRAGKEGRSRAGRRGSADKCFVGSKTLKSAEFSSDDLSPIKGLPRDLSRGNMKEAAKMLEFEYAAVLRDRIIELRGEK